MNLNFSNVEWGPVAGQLMKIGAPLIGTIIGGPAGAIAGSVIGALAQQIGSEPTPEAVSEKLANDPAAREAAIQFENDNRVQLEEAVQKTYALQVEQANISLRAEITAGDRFQRWARPACIWSVAITTAGYGLTMVAAGIVMVVTRDPTPLVHLTNLAPALGVALTPAGAVAGVAVWQQTKEKLAGVVQRPPPSALVPGKKK